MWTKLIEGGQDDAFKFIYNNLVLTTAWRSVKRTRD